MKSFTGKGPQGFTIIEMMVALSVLAILIAFGTPMLENTSARSDMKKANEQVAQALRTAKTTARIANTRVFVIVDTDNNLICFAVREKTTCNTKTKFELIGVPSLLAVQLPDSITITGDVTTFSFNALGMVNDEKWNLTLTSTVNSDFASIVSIDNLLGHVVTKCCSPPEEES